MVRRSLIIFLLALIGCATPSASLPTVTPQPTPLVLPALPPVGPTILPSDYNTRPPPRATQAANAQPLPVVPGTTPSVNFDSTLRPQFAQDLNIVNNETIYTMAWNFNDDLSEIQGSQRVIFANRTDHPLDEIYFRLFANYPDGGGNIKIQNVRSGENNLETSLEQSDTALRVQLRHPLPVGSVAVLRMDYVIQVPRDAQARYADFTRTDWITTLPTIYPIIPAYDAQGWHTELPPSFGDLVYSDSSIYDVTITAPSQYNVIASGEMIQETKNGDRTTRRFVAAPMRDFDVNLTDRMKRTSARLDDITVNSWYREENAEAGVRALNWAVDAVRVFQEKFGPYPFRELDLVETPTTAGGIEYPGVVTVASDLYQDPAQLNAFEFATAHEVAHQWFYSVVGNDQVNRPWLDEALVQYATLVYFETQYGKDVARTLQQNYFDAQYEAARKRYGDMSAGLPSSAYIEESYGAFVYAKGPKFFQAVRDKIGDEAFFKALRGYYEAYKYRIAEPKDLIEMFQKASGQDITPLYVRWIGG